MPETSATELRAAAPAFFVGGRPRDGLSEQLRTLLVEETAAGLYRCEATFGNLAAEGTERPEFLYFKRDILDFGKSFVVKLGDDTLFEGRIYALEADFPATAGPTLTVLAEDRLQDLRMTRRSRVFVDRSDSDVIAAVATDHGLSPSINLNGPTHRLLAQLNQSDLAFVRDRVRAVGGELWVEGTTLYAKTRTDRGGAATELARGKSLHRVTLTADLAEQANKVVVSGWDVANKSKVSHEATDAVLSAELGATDSAASILSNTMKDRTQVLVHPLPGAADVAQAEADAVFKALARRFVVARGEADTTVALRVGRKVQLKDVGPLFEGDYHLVEVRHCFDLAQGLRTEFVAERPGLGRP